MKPSWLASTLTLVRRWRGQSSGLRACIIAWTQKMMTTASSAKTGGPSLWGTRSSWMSMPIKASLSLGPAIPHSWSIQRPCLTIQASATQRFCTRMILYCVSTSQMCWLDPEIWASRTSLILDGLFTARVKLNNTLSLSWKPWKIKGQEPSPSSLRRIAERRLILT